jgi:hypothetical protein
MRADMRAMEEESERHNPVRRGAGATPSMGLSQFRGGKKHHKNEVVMMDSDSDEELEGGGFLSDLGIPVVSQLAGLVGLGDDHLQRKVGCGKKAEKAGREYRLASLKAHKLAHKALDLEGSGMSEATRMGLHLGKHIHGLHGAGFFDDFVKGIGSAVSTIAPIAMKVLPLLAAGKPRHHHGGASNSNTGAYDGQGKLQITHGGMAGCGTGAGMLGQDGHGVRRGGKAKRAPAGPHDGRKVRAAIVNKVRMERGLSLIEASKYVKEHGLYTPGR